MGVDNTPWKAICISGHLSPVSHSKLASRSGKIIFRAIKEQLQSRTLYSMGFPGRPYVVGIGILFFFRKEFKGGKLMGTASSFVS